jgi:hypothetical protein
MRILETYQNEIIQHFSNRYHSEEFGSTPRRNRIDYSDNVKLKHGIHADLEISSSNTSATVEGVVSVIFKKTGTAGADTPLTIPNYCTKEKNTADKLFKQFYGLSGEIRMTSEVFSVKSPEYHLAHILCPDSENCFVNVSVISQDKQLALMVVCQTDYMVSMEFKRMKKTEKSSNIFANELAKLFYSTDMASQVENGNYYNTKILEKSEAFNETKWKLHRKSDGLVADLENLADCDEDIKKRAKKSMMFNTVQTIYLIDTIEPKYDDRDFETDVYDKSTDSDESMEDTGAEVQFWCMRCRQPCSPLSL